MEIVAEGEERRKEKRTRRKGLKLLVDYTTGRI